MIALSLRRKKLLLDAGPLLTLIVGHYVDQTARPASESVYLLKLARPDWDTRVFKVFTHKLSETGSRAFTVCGLAEALRFRAPKPAERYQSGMRRTAFDAIRSLGLVELHPRIEEWENEDITTAERCGLCDALHLGLLRRDSELFLLTDDARLRAFATAACDRILVLSEVLGLS